MFNFELLVSLKWVCIWAVTVHRHLFSPFNRKCTKKIAIKSPLGHLTAIFTKKLLSDMFCIG